MDRAGILDDAAIVVSSDHGEALGELGVYCDHQTADLHTQQVPAVLVWPGLPAGRLDDALHYQFDLAATLVDLLGGAVPDDWDGLSLAHGLHHGHTPGRSHLVLSHAAWTVQRSVRFADWLVIRTYHHALHGFPDVMAFNVAEDPHEQHNLADTHPDVTAHAAQLLDQWSSAVSRRTPSGIDPLTGVLAEGGGWYIRGRLDPYLQRLRETGRAGWADRLAQDEPYPAQPS
jgi:arylsulfatase A-like enzyme